MDGKTYLSKGADTQVLPQYKLSYLDRSLFHGQSWSRTSLIDLRSVMDDMCWLGYVWRSTRSLVMNENAQTKILFGGVVPDANSTYLHIVTVRHCLL